MWVRAVEITESQAVKSTLLALQVHVKCLAGERRSKKNQLFDKPVVASPWMLNQSRSGAQSHGCADLKENNEKTLSTARVGFWEFAGFFFFRGFGCTSHDSSKESVRKLDDGVVVNPFREFEAIRCKI